MTDYQTMVQSAACHPDWDAEDHAMYLWSEVWFRGAPDGEFDSLIPWVQNHLDSERFKEDLAAVLGYASAWNNA